MDAEKVKPETIAAQALGWIDETTKAVSPPIHMSTTYIRDEDNQYRNGRVYARDHNPSFDQAEAVLCALEHGAQAALFASGMAAATAIFQALKPGDHVIAPKVMYWSLRNWLRSCTSINSTCSPQCVAKFINQLRNDQYITFGAMT